jgi:cysteine desulfurase/selenocysteine lyase
MTTELRRPPPAPPAAYDVEAIRRDFPILARRVYGKPLTYLDNAASAQKPRQVLAAMDRLCRESYANVHRGVHRLSQEATAAYEAARERARRAIGARAADEVVFVRGATEGINLVAASFLAPRLAPGDEILVSQMEHHSNIVPWQLVAAARGARVRAIPIDERGELQLDELEALLTERTRLLAVVQVSNALGTVNPVAEIVRRAHARGVPVLVDGAQALAHLRVDVAALGCDFYVFSGHKLYGPTGIGVLYGRGEHLRAMPPYQGGGEMIRRVSFEGTTFADPPARFEAGTPNIVAAVGLAAALDYLEAVGVEAAAAHEESLLAAAVAGLAAIPGVRLIGMPAHRASVVSFLVDQVHAHDVGTVLDREGVAVRAGHHCAQPVMDRFGVAATSRASFAMYNTAEEVERLLAAVRKVKQFFG